VDTDSDGYLDRIYIGTTFGLMYRVDLGKDAGGEFPALTTTNVRALDGLSTYTQKRVPTTSWIPRVIFDANFDLTNPLLDGQKRPIYFRPSVIFVAGLGKWALSFGAGDREDLWSSNLLPGRFYVFIDDSDLLAAPMTEASLSRVTVAGGLATGDFVLDNSPGSRGWYLVLDADERVITDSFALSGVTIFSTFQPDVEVSGGRDPLCSKTGISRIFIVSTVNGDPFMTTREIVVPTYVTNPYTEMGQTRNPGDESYGDDDLNKVTAEEKDRLLRVMDSLKALLPGNCKFSTMRRDIKTVSADTGVVFIAPVPICIIEKNWRDVS
jgi:Tfp pilus tip-associated adhesin PilY1